jgi:hypothetical protein
VTKRRLLLDFWKNENKEVEDEPLMNRPLATFELPYDTCIFLLVVATYY